jgi:hypothetical protein
MNFNNSNSTRRRPSIDPDRFFSSSAGVSSALLHRHRTSSAVNVLHRTSSAVNILPRRTIDVRSNYVVRDDELVGYCQSDSLSEEGLLTKIDDYFRRRAFVPVRSNERYNSCKYLGLPLFLLHNACQNNRVTTGIVRCLLENFHGAADVADDKG